MARCPVHVNAELGVNRRDGPFLPSSRTAGSRRFHPNLFSHCESAMRRISVFPARLPFYMRIPPFLFEEVFGRWNSASTGWTHVIPEQTLLYVLSSPSGHRLYSTVISLHDSVPRRPISAAKDDVDLPICASPTKLRRSERTAVVQKNFIRGAEFAEDLSTHLRYFFVALSFYFPPDCKPTWSAIDDREFFNTFSTCCLVILGSTFLAK
ncbi:Putative LOC101234602 [Caligus rogercresseyi]|uniref:LOC101234602 n=1 Tax=Caligus rogercresseyi TaxID=217165 RepID=A0A7T8KCP4_CALRO|nr:Putative LOC101234602 [Caligus rogercresseyi]